MFLKTYPKIPTEVVKINRIRSFSAEIFRFPRQYHGSGRRRAVLGDLSDDFRDCRDDRLSRQRTGADAANGMARLAAFQVHYRLSNVPRRLRQVSIIYLFFYLKNIYNL